VLGHLSEAQRRALVIADNQLALNSGWDEEQLRIEPALLQESDCDLNSIGFEEEELVRLLAQQGVDGGLTAEDEIPPVPQTPVTRPGDAATPRQTPDTARRLDNRGQRGSRSGRGEAAADVV
jgi:hypothetical protein